MHYGRFGPFAARKKRFPGSQKPERHRVFPQPEILRDAEVADKVVGKGAAALMIKAGVKKVHGDVVSNAAFELFKMYGTDISYDSLVPHIINRKKDGQCPVETLCGDCTDIDELYCRIADFISGFR